jgi:hypothetical protein
VVLQPQYCLNSIGLGSSAFARHYLRNHFYFLLLWVLRCFSSPRSLLYRGDWPSTSRVAPFGNLRIKDYLHLPPAYRSLSRPSSPPRAKASTVCPCLLSFFRLPQGVNRIDISSACSCYFILRCPSCQRSSLLLRFLCIHNFMWRITDSNR